MAGENTKSAETAPTINLQEARIVLQYIEFDGSQQMGEALVGLLTADNCEDVECFNLHGEFYHEAMETIRKSQGEVECLDLTDAFTVFFVSDGSHLRLDAGDYLVRRTAPDARPWEVWTNDDFKAEYLGITK